MAAPGVGEKRAEIYTYEAPWLIYAMGWSVCVSEPTPRARARADAEPHANADAQRATGEFLPALCQRGAKHAKTSATDV